MWRKFVYEIRKRKYISFYVVDDIDENSSEENLDSESGNEGESGIGTNEIWKVF